MKMMAVFPFTPEVKSIIRSRHEIAGYEIKAILSFNEHAVRLCEYQRQTKIFCTTEIEQALNRCDCLLLIDNNQEYSLDKYYKTYEIARNKGKEIIMSMVLWHEMFPGQTPGRQVKLLSNVEPAQGDFKSRRLLEIQVPIVAVMGLGENCDKLETQLRLKIAFAEKGYHAYSISSNDLGGLFSMDTYPEFIHEKNLSFPEKVIKLNSYLYDICEENQPDVILLGLSGGIAPLSKYDHNYFAETVLVAANALKIDIGVLCHYFIDDDEKMPYEEMQELVWNRYSIPIEAFVMSRQRVGFSGDSKRLDYMFLDDERVSQRHISDTHFSSASVADEKQLKNVFYRIIDLLEHNLDFI